jgi:hypothetical protein
MDSNGLSERFFRERRLLLGVSVVLLANELLGVTISKSAETLGLHFEINNPERLLWGVWLIWLWTIACYMQQLNSIDLRSRYPLNRQTVTQNALCYRIAARRVAREAKVRFRSVIPHELRRSVVVKPGGRSVIGPPMEQQPALRCQVSWTWKDPPANQPALDLTALTFRTHATWQVVGGGDLRDVEGNREVHEGLDVPAQDLDGSRAIYVAARTWTIASTSFGTDYIAPLIIGFSPLAIAAYRRLPEINWQWWPS